MLPASNGHHTFVNPLSEEQASTFASADQIEVSLDDDDDDDGGGGGGCGAADSADSAPASTPKQVLVNAVDFLVEQNDNYCTSWREASHAISEVEQDPSRPPVPGRNVTYLRWRLRRMIESLWFRILTFCLIVFDVALVIIDISLTSAHSADSGSGVSLLQALDLLLTCYFVIEIFLRIAALTPAYFFATWYNAVDFCVVLITFICVLTALSGPATSWAQGVGLLKVLRFVRIFRLLRLYTEKHQLETAARQLVSQNKRRFQQDGYDLDLTYVTKRVIATSFPSTGVWAWYRNPLAKVAAFLDEKHPGKYRLYNLCSERTYDATAFHERVERFHIDDHNVPSLQDMLDFVASVHTWLDEDADNVIVVHCKGGKGRTGTMICLWLIEEGLFAGARDSLQYFGQRRTDTNVGTKFQGVETPSQSRYVAYFEAMKRDFDGQLPPPRRVSLLEIQLRGMRYVGVGNGDDFWFTVSLGRGIDSQVFSAHVGFRRNCQVTYDAMEDVLSIKVTNCPVLHGDTRILFQTTSKTVPKGYEDCPFYFWFNTAFLPRATAASSNAQQQQHDDEKRFKLTLTREELDNPHKSKTWHCFREDFSVTLLFEEKQISVAANHNNKKGSF